MAANSSKHEFKLTHFSLGNTADIHLAPNFITTKSRLEGNLTQLAHNLTPRLMLILESFAYSWMENFHGNWDEGFMTNVVLKS